MDTFRQSKKLSTVSLMLGLFLIGSAAMAGPGSPLDPFNTPIPTGSGHQSKKIEMIPESSAMSTTYVNVDGNDNSLPRMPHTKKKFSVPGLGSKSDKVADADSVVTTKVEKIKIPKNNQPKEKKREASVASVKNDDGVAGGTKGAGSNSSKSLGDGVASGTKKMGDGITSGAKASGSLFMKGAKVIGFKSSDDKSKSSQSSVKNEKKDREKKEKKEKPEPKVSQDKATDSPKQVAKKSEWEEISPDKDAAKDKDRKKKANPITSTFKGTVSGVKDGLHSATDKLSITKPSSGKETVGEKIAEQSATKGKSKNKQAESTYLAHGKAVKKKTDGNGLMSKTLGILPFVGGSKKDDNSSRKVARQQDDDALVTDSSPRKSAHKEEELLGPSL